MSDPTPPWEAETLEAFAAGTSRAGGVASAPAWPTPLPLPPVRSAAHGGWSLGLALAPVVVYAVAIVWMLVESARPDAGMFAGLGAVLIGAIVAGCLALICLPLSIAFGVIAVRRRAGFGLGVAGITISGLVLLQVAGPIAIGVISALLPR